MVSGWKIGRYFAINARCRIDETVGDRSFLTLSRRDKNNFRTHCSIRICCRTVGARGDFQMRAWLRNSLLAFSIAVAAGFVSLPPAHAVEPLEIRWEQLIPASLQAAPHNLMAKLLPHGQTKVRANMSVSQRSDLVAAYNGQRVKIVGFVLPFNNEEQPYKRLLLIPFSGACVKFPPPRNQAILVIVEKGIRTRRFCLSIRGHGRHERGAHGNRYRQDRLSDNGRGHRTAGIILYNYYVRFPSHIAHFLSAS